MVRYLTHLCMHILGHSCPWQFAFHQLIAFISLAIVDICDEDKTVINNLVSSATMTNSKKIENNGVVVLSQEMMAKGEKLTGREI